MIKRSFMRKFIFIIFISLSTNLGIAGINFYVNPTLGSDLTGNGSFTNPFKTLSKAGQMLNTNSVDTIYIIGSTHTSFKDEFRRNDLQTNWIFIRPYQNPSVTLNGIGKIFWSWEAVLNIQSSKFIDIRNINIIGNNDSSSGIRIVSDELPTRLSQYVRILNCKINNVKRQGILIQAKNVLVENCEIDSAVLINKNEQLISGGWPSAISTYLWPTTLVQNDSIIIRNNYVHNVWGEGIGLVRAKNIIVENNHVRDCYSVGIYMDNSRYGKVRGNWIHSTSDYYNRHFTGNYYAPANGIFWAAEGSPQYVQDSIVRNIDIYNNLIVRTSAAFGWFNDLNNNFSNDSYKKINIYYNTIYKTIGYETFYIDINLQGNRVPPDSCIFKNNIICKPYWSNSYQSYFTTSSDFNNYWTIQNNCFMHGPSTFLNNITGPVSFYDSNYFQIADSLKIKTTSICKGAGINIASITTDYWKLIRNSPPCIGFHENGGLPISILNNEQEINKYELDQNYPNPFNPVTKINYELPKEERVKLVIYDILGREVKQLVNEFKQAGKYIVEFNGNNLASGIYFYRIEIGNFVQVKKMMLIK